MMIIMDYEYNDCVDLLFEFNKEDLSNGGIEEIVAEALAERTHDIVNECKRMVENEQ